MTREATMIDIVAFQQRARRRMAHAVDLLVDHRVFFDIGVGLRDIGFGLVIIVIADEIFDGVIGEKRFHFPIQLRRQCFVGRENQRGSLQSLDHMRDGKSLARTRDAEQNLIAFARIQAARQSLYRLRLISGGAVVGHELELPPGFRAKVWTQDLGEDGKGHKR